MEEEIEVEDFDKFDKWFHEKYGFVSTRDPMMWQAMEHAKGWAWLAWKEAWDQGFEFGCEQIIREERG